MTSLCSGRHGVRASGEMNLLGVWEDGRRVCVRRDWGELSLTQDCEKTRLTGRETLCGSQTLISVRKYLSKTTYGKETSLGS
jgi:hypothetical protein